MLNKVLRMENYLKGNYVINNEQRDVGVITGSYITQCHGIKGLPEGQL